MWKSVTRKRYTFIFHGNSTIHCINPQPVYGVQPFSAKLPCSIINEIIIKPLVSPERNNKQTFRSGKARVYLDPEHQDLKPKKPEKDEKRITGGVLCCRGS